MKYQITHTTRYTYDHLVPVSQNMVYLAPRSDQGQKNTSHELLVKPEPSSSFASRDFFGNNVAFYVIAEGHRELVVTATRPCIKSS